MTTQPQFPNPGRPGAGPVAPSGGRPPRRPQPVIPASPQNLPFGACPEPVEGGPSNQHPRPTAVPRQSAPPNPPSPRLPTRPSHLVRTAPSPAPNWPNSAPPRPQEFFGKNSYTRTSTPASRCRRPATQSTRPSVIPASSAGTQRQPASQGLRATPSIPRPQPHRLVRPAQLTDHPSVPPDAEDSPIRRKKPPQAISGQPVPSGDRLARDSSPLLPQAAAGAHRRPTVTLTPRSPKAREGFARWPSQPPPPWLSAR